MESTSALTAEVHRLRGQRTSMSPVRVLAFGTYDTRRHPRVGVLIEGLRDHGDEVREVVVPMGLDTRARLAILRQPWRLPLLAARVLRCWARLAVRGRAVARSWRPDAVLVGYLGHFDVLLARRLFPGTPVVLDHLVFASDTAADRGETGQLKARLLRGLDRAALSAADVVVLDTTAHTQLLPPRLRARAVVAAVGADRSWGAAATDGERSCETQGLRVVFFGLFTPLHGAPVIGQALGKLATDPGITVLMIGTGQDLEQTRAAAAANPRVTWRSWVPLEQLPELVAGYDVCLGIFGTTPKAHRVVPNKVYQAAAAGCAIITSDTGPQRAALGDDAVLIPPGDPVALADAVRRLSTDRAELARLRTAARTRAARDFTPAAVVTDLREHLLGTVRKTAPGTPTGHPDGTEPDVTPLPSTRPALSALSAPSAPHAPLPPRAHLRYAVVRRLVASLAPSTILEIGAGQGGFGVRLASTATYLGVEPDEHSAAVALNRLTPRGGRVIVGDDTAVPAGSRYDLVCAFEVLEHIDDDEAALARWTGFVRPGGHLLLSVPAWPHRFGPMDEVAGHYRRYHPDTIGELLTGAGLQAPVTRLYGWPLGYALEGVRNRIDRRKLTGNAQEPATMAERTGASGRTFQPGNPLMGIAVKAATAPFIPLQWLVPGRGIGLVAVGRRPV